MGKKAEKPEYFQKYERLKRDTFWYLNGFNRSRFVGEDRCRKMYRILNNTRNICISYKNTVQLLKAEVILEICWMYCWKCIKL